MEPIKEWQAKWIWTEGLPRNTRVGDHELAYFRRTFDVPAGDQCKLVVQVSADSRYRLYLNGKSIAIGPCKGDNHTHYYETIDISDQLIPGKNVLAAKVLHFTNSEPWKMGLAGPISVWRSDSGAFIMEGSLQTEDGFILDELRTDDQWLCKKDEGYSIEAAPLIQWLGGVENVDGNHIPHGWQEIHFNDQSWANAVAFYDTRNDFGEMTCWPLSPRPIPFLYENEQTFKGITRIEGATQDRLMAVFGNTEQPLLIKAGSKLMVELDAGELTTGYLTLQLAGGKGGNVKILCSECYEPEESNSGKVRIKGIRDQVEEHKLVGDYDTYSIAGWGHNENNTLEIYEPFWFRTFRYVRLEIEADREDVTLHRFDYRETGYPLDIKGEFECSDPDFNKLWELSINTLKRCMHETYEDCPYYEQLQYTMDTRLQMLFTYNLSTDDRLARRAIYDFHSSMLPSGMLQCRYPSMYPQVIPAFSLYWIHMLHEHYLHFADRDHIQRYRPTVLALLDWFERRRTPEGIVGLTPDRYWTHFDWVEEWPGGAPPSKDKGPMSLHSMMYAASLKKAADLLDWTGWTEVAEELRNNAEDVNQAVLKTCWSEEKQLFSNNPNIGDYSQHPQIWAILSGAVKDEQARRLLARTFSDPDLPVASLPMTYNLFRALESMGMYEEAFTHWDRWRRYIGLHLTTLPERAHKTPRSDCHAWSAVPLAEFPGMILGVKPGEPGYQRIRIEPHPASLSWAKGKVSTLHGLVEVDWRIDEGRFFIKVDGPMGIPIDLQLPDGTSHTFNGSGTFEAKM